MSLSTVAVLVVAALHTGFFVIESVLWTSPEVMRIFGNTPQEAQTTTLLALNQGFYNLGAAALLIGFHATGHTAGVMGVLLFLAGMGLVGAITANGAILLVQTLPALVALLIVYRV